MATRYERCPTVFLSTIALAALVIYWLCVLTLGQAQILALRFGNQTQKLRTMALPETNVITVPGKKFT